ncbi:hypothetical protein [Natronobiforma cellulositropha]|uniref:hypothetical protein n=1 Tax=Natronobiforma cellulositropha TaxID=1679076 RepID=UPI0021D5CF23|nr:hypothetical protein [Natronobiforma cellulositropha]
MIRAVFFAGVLLLGLVGIILLYRVSLRRIEAKKELRERELEHEERKALFDDDEL